MGATLTSQRVLVVEDDAKFGSWVARLLRERDLGADVVTTADEAIRHGLDDSHSVILLDWNLPDVDGLEVVRRLRAARVTTPILMITGRAAVPDRVLALQTGADDYLVKPFDFRELAARIEALVRRTRGAVERILHAGRITVDLSSHEVYVDESRVGLTQLELRLLLLLLHRGTHVARRSEILAALWGTAGASSNVLDVHVGRLRDKLGPAGGQIETIRGVGYRLRHHTPGPASE
jgi:DNA-binding response OmpR family regulator